METQTLTYEEIRKQMLAKYIIKESDMPSDMQNEVVDAITSAIEKNNSGLNEYNYEAAAKLLKETLDKKYGPHWHVVMGEGFACDVHTQQKTLLYMYYTGSIACLVYKA